MSASDPQNPRSGSSPTTPQRIPPLLTAEQQRMKSIAYNVALVTLIAAPAIAFIPPRKLDFYTMGLGVTWVLCANHLMDEHGFYNKKAMPIGPAGPTAAQIMKLEEERRAESGMSISERMQKDLLQVWGQGSKKDDEGEKDMDDDKRAILEEVRELEAKRRIEERFKDGKR